MLRDGSRRVQHNRQGIGIRSGHDHRTIGIRYACRGQSAVSRTRDPEASDHRKRRRDGGCFGKSFFTEDPRTGSATGQDTPTGAPAAVDPVETASSDQLVASKTLHKTELKLALGHETQTAESGKIDPDDGLQFDLGPGRIRYLAATLRHSFSLGALQATFEQADARDLDTWQVTPKAPRLIGLRLPGHLVGLGLRSLDLRPGADQTTSRNRQDVRGTRL